MKSIEQAMRYCRNYFVVPGKSKEGHFCIEDGIIDLPFLVPEQFFKIEGSVFNDGVYRYTVDVLVDEEFDGRIVPLAVPKDFIAVCKKIEEFDRNNSSPGIYQSESFGGYSYTLAKNPDGTPITGIGAFAADLKRWKKL